MSGNTQKVNVDMFWIAAILAFLFFYNDNNYPSLRQAIIYQLTGEKIWIEKQEQADAN